MTDFNNDLIKLTIGELLCKYPYATDYFANMRLDKLDHSLPLLDALGDADEEILEEFGHTKDSILLNFSTFLSSFTSEKIPLSSIESLTICGGKNKTGVPEDIEFTVWKGEIISIVGPTGSGKSRLLEDIECLAQRDSPTQRQILINGIIPGDNTRFSTEGRLIAQVSQNMNFVMDITVKEFLEMHAKSRMIPNIEEVTRNCFETANTLAGEKFAENVKVTQLSGGQSRALMIADTALMSSSPIILIDEIENAGIDRRKALELLSRKDKIVLMSTHDPILALNGDKRIVISNGGISAVLETTEEEKEILVLLEKMDAVLQKQRNALRYGKHLTKEMLGEN
ncbi:MAG TPA: ABC transporter ATP-binding protein [Methanocorpusculum sp.]|nr:ABC transporter ATP-binding protein [Methanocorpusculum sp.]HJJ40224.1 ABC transporter ATP-binding protein [Methanocorpusculum sp.]HJJ49613.1 ABC transporter ATP-binding protein [Methanocorpusculum sp.]HJJ57698.1 ABC transporter ATP-binding protein [Methanocorpusculum sp.]